MLMRMTTCLNVTGRLAAVFLCLMLVFPFSHAVAADGAGDEFLTGYIASILERDLHWERDSYILKIVNGVATITLFKDDPVRREAVDKQLRTIDGLQGIAIVVMPVGGDKPGAVSRFMELTGQAEAFPMGDPFQPLIADPKQPQFFGSRERDALQLSVEGSLFAQFNMNTPSYDLINADYTIGIPVTYRHGDNSLRVHIYHQSSHLGDEFLQSVNPPEQVNLSYEAIELIYSRE